MALKHKEERFVRWTHVENGNVPNRRLHRIEVQARDGRLYVLKGDELPDFIQTCTGQGYRGEHLMQVLLNPRGGGEWSPPETKPWPVGRDALHVMLGVAGFLLLRFAAGLA